MAVIILLMVSTGLIVLTPAHAGAEEHSFSDVKQGAWYASAVKWGASAGIISGYEDGTFKPNQIVTEAEFLAMLLRSYESNIVAKKNSNWSGAYYTRAKELNYPVTSYTELASRNKAIHRTQVAELISSAEGVNFSGDDAIHYMLAFGLAEGANPNSSDLPPISATID